MAASATFLLAGCSAQDIGSVIGGCIDTPVSRHVSTSGQHVAVTRECGCRASTGLYLATFVVAAGADESCAAPSEVAVHYHGGQPQVAWKDDAVDVRVPGLTHPSCPSSELASPPCTVLQQDADSALSITLRDQ